MQKATTFFLPIEDRSKHLPPLKNFNGKFWHTGIIFKDGVYECFNHGKWSKEGLGRLNDEEFKNAIFVETKVFSEKILSELKSGTDCAEYVARCTGLSDLAGSEKGNLWPDDIYKILLNKE